MAGSGSKNPWLDDDDMSRGYGGGRSVGGGSGNPFQGGKDPFLEDEDFSAPLSPYEELQQQKQMSMNRTLQGTERAMASICDSERMGVATAEELVHQGEQLDNVERKLDGINTNLKTSQRHLTGIKSVFGGIKNWWNGAPKAEPPKEPERRRPETTLTTHMEASAASVPSSRTDHPGLRNTRGLYDDSDSQPKQKQMTAEREQYEEQYNRNLDAMSAGLARLKGLGMGLGEEIEAQNDQIDRITTKTDGADIKIKDQNRQIRGVLGK